MFGHAPVKKILVGKTELTKRKFESSITSETFGEKYNTDNYDVLKNNCNDFCRDALKIALGENSILPDEVEEILDNTKIITSSPSAEQFLKYFESGKNFGLNFIQQLMGRTSNKEDLDAFQNILDIFSRKSSLSGKGGNDDDSSDDNKRKSKKISLEEEEVNEVDDNGLSPEAAITGILEFFESFSSPSPNNKIKPPKINQETDEEKRRRESKAKLPPGAQKAAMNFGKNLVDAIHLINKTISLAVEDTNENSLIVSKKSKADLKKNLTMLDKLEEGEENVPLTKEVELFLDTVFKSTYEQKVLKSIRVIFEKNGYYEMMSLKGISEEELIQIGVRRGWAKKIKIALDEYFN